MPGSSTPLLLATGSLRSSEEAIHASARAPPHLVYTRHWSRVCSWLRMLAGDREAEFERDASEFLASVRGPVGVRLSPALVGLLSEVITLHVRKRVPDVLGFRGVDDIAADVLERLVAKPPEMAPEGECLRRLRAWVRTTAYRRALDVVRREGELWDEPPVDSTGNPRVEAHDERYRPGAEIELDQRLQRARACLEREFPRGLAMFDLTVNNPQITSQEIAAELGLSVANVDKIRSLVRRRLAMLEQEDEW